MAALDYDGALAWCAPEVSEAWETAKGYSQIMAMDQTVLEVTTWSGRCHLDINNGHIISCWFTKGSRVNHSGVRLSESQDAADFCSQADRRATLVALLDAITAYERNRPEAELIWRTGLISGLGAQTSEEWLSIGVGVGSAAGIFTKELRAALGDEVVGIEPVAAHQHRIERT